MKSFKQFILEKEEMEDSPITHQFYEIEANDTDKKIKKLLDCISSIKEPFSIVVNPENEEDLEKRTFEWKESDIISVKVTDIEDEEAEAEEPEAEEPEAEVNESMDLSMQITQWVGLGIAGITGAGFVAAVGQLGIGMLKFAINDLKSKFTSSIRGKEFFSKLESTINEKNKDAAKLKLQQLGEFDDVLVDIKKLGKTESQVAEGIEKAIANSKK